MEKIKKVGVFDSGIGGLTVLSECLARVKGVQFYYLGDNENAPYGSKSAQEITALVREALCVFKELEVDAAVLACNTATAVCADVMRREFSFPVVGMEPAVRPAAAHCKSALVLCTPQTAKSPRLNRLIASLSHCRFQIVAASHLAEAIERALTMGEQIRLYEHLPAASTLDPDCGGVVLGCTHYIYFKKEIEQFYSIPVYDGNVGTVNQLIKLLGMSENVENSGIGDHLLTTAKVATLSPIFLGKCAKINEKTAKANKRFQKFLYF